MGKRLTSWERRERETLLSIFDLDGEREQRQCDITAGEHEIVIETIHGGTAGAGDQLTKTFNFPQEVEVTLWVYGTDGFTSAIFYVDDQVIWSASPFYQWEQETATISAGIHEIRIESNYAGNIWIDELEIASE